jgi:hypothetical protein
MGKKLTTGNIRILFLQCFSLPPGTTCSYLGLRKLCYFFRKKHVSSWADWTQSKLRSNYWSAWKVVVLVLPSVFISCALHFWRIISNNWTRFLVDYTSSRVSDHGDFCCILWDVKDKYLVLEIWCQEHNCKKLGLVSEDLCIDLWCHSPGMVKTLEPCSNDKSGLHLWSL